MIDFDGTVLAACETAFGETVTYIPGSGPPAAVAGVFDRAYKEITFQNDMPVAVTRPMLGCRASSFAAPPCAGEQFQVRGSFYQVAEVHADGIGHLKILLMDAQDRPA